MIHSKKDRAMLETLSDQDRKDWELYLLHIFNSPSVFQPPVEKVMPSRRLDLHGMTVGEAHHRTSAFLADHREAATADVVIITGKSGQISHEFTEWLRLDRNVRRYEPIIDSRGGVGSYRIWLKR